ncbi:MAG: hypothetical protein IKZ19_04410, partial [Clostridia bacterium]|nr:hypothetical protein [Clostridia bacterium]
YGDRGNVTVLTRALENMGTEVSVTETEEPSSVNPSDFDFIYCGAGTENKIALAAKKLAPAASAFKTAAEKGVSMLFTGSAMELVCSEIRLENETVKALGIFDAAVRRTSDRQTGDVLYNSDFFEKLLAGFINKSGFICTSEKPLFKPWFGPSSFEDEHLLDISGEGLGKYSVRATYVTGPVLVRNPWFKRIIAAELFAACENGKTPSEYADEYAEKGWKVTVSELEKRKNANL